MRAGRPLLLGIDIGTSSSKAVVLTPSGVELGHGSASHEVVSRENGHLEIDPEAWWTSVSAAVCECRRGPEASVGEIAAVGLSGQMHGAVLIDREGRVQRPAILWPDRRAADQVQRLAGCERGQVADLGGPAFPGMTGPLLAWLTDHEPAVLRRAAMVLQAKDFLRLRFTGKAATERTDASGTLLYDLHTANWSDWAVQHFGVDRGLLPPIGVSSNTAGPLTGPAAAALDLPAGLPVAYGAADTAASLLGGGHLPPGEVRVTVGTGAQVVVKRDRPRPDPAGRYHVFAAAPDGFYALAAIQAAGLALEWCWRVLGLDWRAAYAALQQAPEGAKGALFIPHLAGARSPWMIESASGAWSDLRIDHERGDLVRAAFEGVAFSIREAAESLPEFATAAEISLAGGGATERLWCQLLTDVLAKPVLLDLQRDASARGAALLGGMATGLVSLTGPPESAHHARFEPSAAAARLAEAYQRWVQRSQQLRQEVMPPPLPAVDA
ncbi:MAG: xylulokinase [Acetobacteraceae bacterium]